MKNFFPEGLSETSHHIGLFSLAAAVIVGVHNPVALAMTIATALLFKSFGGGSFLTNEQRPARLEKLKAAYSIDPSHRLYGKFRQVVAMVEELSEAAGLDERKTPVVLCGYNGIWRSKIIDGSIRVIHEPGLAAVLSVNEGFLDEDKYTDEERYGILAHEIGHLMNRDYKRFPPLENARTFTNTYVRINFFHVAFISALSLFSSGSGTAAAPLATSLMLLPFPFALGLALIVPLVTNFIAMHYRRQREFAADKAAAKLIDNPVLVAYALAKHHTSKSTVRPEKMTALCMQLWRKTFSTHPAMEDRVIRLLKMADEQTIGQNLDKVGELHAFVRSRRIGSMPRQLRAQMC
ncbi:MAG: M48 family metalloprotease [Alphaproteobacteria bacterium]|nr:M48 family metalloprotease [Alphaproteobacteria bacterium]